MFPKNLVIFSYREAVEFRHRVEAEFPDLQNNGCFEIPVGDRFWKLYRAQNQNLKHAKIFVYPENGEYTEGCTWIAEAKPLFSFTDMPAFQDWMQKCFPHCDLEALEQMHIQEKVAKNGAVQYRLLCPQCEQLRSRAIPHPVVDHLVTEIGLCLQMPASRLQGGAEGEACQQEIPM